MRFADIITNRKELRSVLNEPSELVTRKTLDHLDKHCGKFIGRSPFLLIASVDAAGNVDVSPRGDPSGFAKVLDSRTLVVPERPGNNRADTMENILQVPKVGLIFLVPGKRETLRVGGVASIVRDAPLLESLAVGGRAPRLAIAIEVQEAFFHCSKCMIRSKLWEPADWPDLEGLPRLAETMVDAGKLELSESEMHQIVENDERERLY